MYLGCEWAGDGGSKAGKPGKALHLPVCMAVMPCFNGRAQIFPERAQRGMVVGCVSRHGKALVFFTVLMILIFFFALIIRFFYVFRI